MNHIPKKISVFTIAFLIGGMALSPLLYAQTATTTDGSNDSVSTRRQYIRGWRGQSSDLQQKINTLDSTVSASVLMPVLFGVELNNLHSDFGDARSNGRTHIGNDIMAVKGTPIVSPTKAVVLRIGVGSGEGNYVYTANPGGETFVYMHLDRFGEGVAAGTVLEKGDLIGYVGNTGNASGGAAHLHFEIHDNAGTPINPFPRLTGTLTLQEKIQYLNAILAKTADANALAMLLVTNFRSTFNSALAINITLPSLITSYMSSLPSVPAPAVGTVSNLPPGDLALGSKGSEVISLQQYLISKNAGAASVRLAQAGATGNFGSITESALIEYQISVGISPADGYYGAITRAKVIANTNPSIPAPQTTPTSSPVTTPTQNTSTSLTLTRDLTLNSIGEDVRMLQKFLNSHGYVVATSGSGSVGNETTYFGPATRAAVIRFQAAYGITPQAGYVGSITRAKLTSLGI